MRFKLDENLDVTLAPLLQKEGHASQPSHRKISPGNRTPGFIKYARRSAAFWSLWTWITRIRYGFQSRAHRASSSFGHRPPRFAD